MIKTILILYTLTASLVLAEPNKEALEAANKLTTALGLKGQMTAGFNAMMPLINQQTAQLNLTDEESKELINIYREWFKNDLDQDKMSSEITNIYAKNFTVNELEQLTVFYNTPLGKKTLKLLPLITTESAKIGMVEAQAKQHLLLEKITPFIEKTKK